MKFLISRRILDAGDIKNLKKKYHFSNRRIGVFNLLTEEVYGLKSNNGLTSIIDGYIRNFNFDAQDLALQEEKSIEFMKDKWPVSNSITGSFSCTIIDETKEEVILCNDSIGVYPLYFQVRDKDLFISNSLVWMGALAGAELDDPGLFQRTYCPEFANIGSRTLLKNTKRLLPGEWIRFNKSGAILDRKFDNELYQNITSKEYTLEYWDQFKKELEYCVAGEERLNVALSGGMDSRLIMSGLPKEKKVFCHTYGQENFYETQVAKKIAVLYNARFRNYSQPELYFPSKEILQKYTLETEAIYVNSWLEILEAEEREKRETMLLGDMAESLQGRNLPVHKNPENFFKYFLQRKPYPFKENTPEEFYKWKKDIIRKYTKLLFQTHLNRINVKSAEGQIREGIINDLEDIFVRIEQHNLPYMELVTELFSWLTHARIPMGKQILIVNSDFRSYCVPMSIQILRLTSNLHPDLRINGRFVKSLFSSVKELRSAGNIPTSQIPYVPFNAPDLLKIPVWFGRSGIDDLLIKRLMRSGDPGKRYRLLNSFNWAVVYQQPHLESILRSYFEKNYIGQGYAEGIIKGALARKTLEQWPLSNTNIINAAALNTELKILDSVRCQ